MHFEISVSNCLICVKTFPRYLDDCTGLILPSPIHRSYLGVSLVDKILSSYNELLVLTINNSHDRVSKAVYILLPINVTILAS